MKREKMIKKLRQYCDGKVCGLCPFWNENCNFDMKSDSELAECMTRAGFKIEKTIFVMRT